MMFKYLLHRGCKAGIKYCKDRDDTIITEIFQNFSPKLHLNASAFVSSIQNQLLKSIETDEFMCCLNQRDLLEED